MAQAPKKSPGIRVRAGKNGSVTYQVRYYDPTGERRAKTFPTKTAAKRFHAAVATDKDRGEWIDHGRGKVTVGEWAKTWDGIQGRPPRL